MRSFENRIAEIDRRSKEILKTREKHRRIFLLFTLPLLCVCVSVVAFFSKSEELKDNKQLYAQESTAENDPTQYKHSDYIMISYGDGSTLYEADDVNTIQTLLGAIVSKTNLAEDDPNEPADQDAHEQEEETDNSRYFIFIESSDGKKSEYILCDGRLIDLATGDRYIVTEEEFNDLKKALGVSLEK